MLMGTSATVDKTVVVHIYLLHLMISLN